MDDLLFSAVTKKVERMKPDTHILFNTIGHEHIGQNLKEVCLTECADGRWFVENDWCDVDFENINGISNPHIFPYNNPTFFVNEENARKFAIEIIQSLLPDFIYTNEE